ncbi:AraC family transcriptional regulator [Enterococcus sp. LJL128]|uniref:AraC family transcriptional regulator n=1 Tax=Enterococcus sp. LJL51 TaxID=3416656 RepID=UPI003CF49407
MHAWEAIQKTVDYIEKNLTTSLPIEELSEIANLSPFYYQRLFSRLVRKPVKEYIKYRRLAGAEKMLKNKQLRIIDVALELGFNNHETFTRAFKEAYNMTPEAYRENPVMLNQFDKPDLVLNYVMVDEGVPLISDGLILEFNRKTLEKPIHFLGFEGYVPIQGQMPNGEATGVDIPGEVWGTFHKNKQDIPRITNGREIGVAYAGNAPEGHFTYYAGAEVGEDVTDSRFQSWQLPARDYIVCGFEAENFEELVTVAINKAVKYCGFWLEKHHLTMETYSPELYYDSSPEASYMEFWLPVITLDK